MRREGTTRLSRAFCSARDCNIPVLVRDAPDTGWGMGDRRGPSLVACLDFGVRCTGWLCPLFTVPEFPPEELLPEAMNAERARRRAVAQRLRSESPPAP